MIDTEKILIALKIEYRNGGSSSFRIKCINAHNHKNGDIDPSLHIHTTSGVMHCFSCGYKGFITELIKQSIGTTDDIEVLAFLNKFSSGIGSHFNRTEYYNNRSTIKEETGIKFPLHRSAVNNPYLNKRGFSNREIEDWQIGIINDNDYMRNNGWVYIPIYQDKELKNYFMRNSFGNDKLYGPYPKKTLLAGYDKIKNFDSIYVLEGIFKAIAFNRTRNQSVSSLGNQLSKEQLKLLKQFKKVVIVPDNDNAGLLLIKTALPLIYSVDLRVCTLPLNKKDADECTLDELLYSQLHEMPVQDFLSKKLIKNFKIA